MFKKILISLLFLCISSPSVLAFNDDINAVTSNYKTQANDAYKKTQKSYNDTLSNYKSWYNKNNTYIEALPYLKVRKMDTISWLIALALLLWLMLKFL